MSPQAQTDPKSCIQKGLNQAYELLKDLFTLKVVTCASSKVQMDKALKEQITELKADPKAQIFITSIELDGDIYSLVPEEHGNLDSPLAKRHDAMVEQAKGILQQRINSIFTAIKQLKELLAHEKVSE